MLLTHRIRLEATSTQRDYFKTIHRDAHAQPFAHLARAWRRHAGKRQGNKPVARPTFKKQGRCRDTFCVANDKCRLEGKSIVLPKVGRVVLAEALRYSGKVMGANVSREADHWYLAVRVELPERKAYLKRRGNGVDLGVDAAAVLSTGEKIRAPRPLTSTLRRVRIRCRRQSRKVEAAKLRADIVGAVRKGVHLPVSRNRDKGARALGRLYANIAHVRIDFTHKLTNRLCHENQAVVIEDLNDVNAAINLQRLATGALAAQTALPEASQAVTHGTTAGTVPAAGGKVTPVRYEHGQQDGPGRKRPVYTFVHHLDSSLS